MSPEKKVHEKQEKREEEKRLEKALRTSAVLLTTESGAKVTYTQALSLIRAKINLAEIAVTEIRPKRATTGVLEVLGRKGDAEMNILALGIL